MGLFDFKPPWYVAGLAFECTQCGACCAGPEEGYIWTTDQEIQAIGQFLGLDEQQVRQRYVRRQGRRQTLIEDPKTNDCVFLQLNATCTGKGCSLYEVRPAQCRTWPFWPSNLSSPKAWAQAGQRCPGINRGRVYTFEEIQARCDATGH